MIFVTVGVQLPFDRLIRAVDGWAGTRGRADIVAQAGASAYRPQHLALRETLAPKEFRTIVEEAELVVAQAGMGSIITALELGKRIVVMPRRADLGEHRNDHQLSTARYMAEQNLVTVAKDADDLVRLLDEPVAEAARRPISSEASAPLMGRIVGFLDEEAKRRGLARPTRGS
jgi:UDP-N-acetylglucosamine transferase subunit ALG13